MDQPLLSLRSALVFLLAVLSGVAAGGLSWLAGEGAARSVLVGLAVASMATPFFDRLITPGSGETCGKAHDHG
ncbi:hypothetical protein [Streptomyces huasconensis]|uniref:hypothetical protein n=1 Tax=Streptomyces huasconensis TaxID=1854574 RepID=UPI0033EE1026